MRWMSGEAAVPGVVGVLFGVGERGSRRLKSKVNVKSPTLNRKKRDLEWGTLEVPNTLGSLDTLEVPGSFGESFTGATCPASTRSQSKATPTATSNSTAADRSVRGTHVTYKRLGERAEAAFLAKVAGLGFGVAKPWGDSDRYDFIVDAGGKLRRVQVKSAHRVGADGGYSLRLFGHSVGAYREDEIDFLVCYLAPEDAWYVFPPEVFMGRRSVKLFGGSVRRRSKFEVYREGWWRLGGISAAKAAVSGKN